MKFMSVPISKVRVEGSQAHRFLLSMAASGCQGLMSSCDGDRILCKVYDICPLHKRLVSPGVEEQVWRWG